MLPKVRKWMFKIMRVPTCEEVDHFAYEFLDGLTDTATTQLIERHLHMCKVCRNFMESYRKTRALGHAEKVELDPEFRERVFHALCSKSL